MTPFEVYLRHISLGVTRANDLVALAVIARAIDCVRRGEYDAARGILHELAPEYRTSIPIVPRNRSEDLGMDVIGPGTTSS